MKSSTVILAIVMILLSACATPQRSTPALVTPAAVMPTTVVATAVVPTPTTVQPTTAPVIVPTVTVTAAQPIPVTGEASLAEAVVSENGLNLRVGPGLNHHILGVLGQGQKVQLEGRSVDGDWIVVRLPDGKEGWVFGAYLRTSASLTALPVAEAYGGPVNSGQQPTPAAIPGKYSLYMTIADNQAVVSLARFPASQDVVVRLGVPGGQAMTVATGKTSADGSASFTFDMPYTWEDGSPVTQSQLLLTAATADGAFTRNATITYEMGE